MRFSRIRTGTTGRRRLISIATSRRPTGRTSRASTRRTPTSRPFVRQGGKLILSGGWNNALVPAGAVLDYYNRVVAAIGRDDARRAVRLYMVPGMIECNGGPGTDTFDMLGVMRRWVERGQAPNESPRHASSTARWCARVRSARIRRWRRTRARAARTRRATSSASSQSPRARGAELTFSASSDREGAPRCSRARRRGRRVVRRRWPMAMSSGVRPALFFS